MSNFESILEVMYVLVAYTLDYKNHTSLTISKPGHRSVEIHGPVKMEIVIGLLNNYRLRLKYMPMYSGPVIVVDAGKDEDELFRTVEKLQELGPIRRKVLDEMLGEPTLENVKKFVALKVLVDGGGSSEA